jgi:ribosomal protein S6--L-glutamate ligase
MRIGVLMLRHPQESVSPVNREVIRLLTEWGARVDVVYPEERAIRLAAITPEHDLYVLKSRTEMALGLAGALHAAGAAILNPYPVASLLRDKITSSRVLQAAGVPVPETFVTAHPDQLIPLLADGPLAIKPYRGGGARGIHVVWDADELDDIPTNQGPIFAQRFVESMGHVRKVYCIGGHLFGVERGLPARVYEEKIGRPFTSTPELREIAVRCGKAFGIDVFGLDVLGDDRNPCVVEMHGFPGFKGVPDAALRLADHIYYACQRVLRGEPFLPDTETAPVK